MPADRAGVNAGNRDEVEQLKIKRNEEEKRVRRDYGGRRVRREEKKEGFLTARTPFEMAVGFDGLRRGRVERGVRREEEPKTLAHTPCLGHPAHAGRERNYSLSGRIQL